MKFEKLLEPFDLCGMRLKNRMVMPAMSPDFATLDGFVTQTFLDYWEERARGGVGLMIAGYGAIEFPKGVTGLLKLAIDDDKFIPGIESIATISHKYGASVAMQLNHAGGFALKADTGLQPVAPSAVVVRADMPKELTVGEIQDLVARFAKGAERAKKAGFDAIEIHAATGYLLDEFLSPAYNRRTDAYGGELKNRARFLLEILGAVRRVVGQGFPLWVRINGTEYGVKNGITLDDAKGLAVILEQSGCCAVNVTYYDKITPFAVMEEPAGSQLQLAEGIKGVVNIPVMITGRMTPDVGERALREGKADLIVTGRQLFADAEIANKLAAGRLDDIRPCITCSRCGGRRGKPVQCAVNPDLGKEREYRITPVRKRKKVLVVGGGPAGMQAAIVAAQRGHEVTLYERNRLGGQLHEATAPPHKDNMKLIAPYLASQVKKVGVKVVLGKEATAEVITELKPDVVILATGAVTCVPGVPGAKDSNVVSVLDVLKGSARVGNRVVVIGGDMVGCEAAEFLAGKGKTVTVIEEREQMATKLLPHMKEREPLMSRLEAAGVNMLASTRCTRITEKGVEVESKGVRQIVGADTVVLALLTPNQELLHGAKSVATEVHPVGDCVEPRDLMNAIHDGARIGRAV